MQKLLLYCTALLFAGACYAEPSDEDKLIKQLMLQQDVVAVNGVTRVEDFVPDKKPNTLQVVFLADPAAKSSVSEDGEVVFLNPDISVNAQAMLTREAFRRKAKRILAIKVPPLPNNTP